MILLCEGAKQYVLGDLLGFYMICIGFLMQIIRIRVKAMIRAAKQLTDKLVIISHLRIPPWKMFIHLSQMALCQTHLRL